MQASTADNKKILIIASEFPPNPGGIGNQAYNLALFLSKENFSVNVVADLINVSDAELEQFKDANPFIFFPIQRNNIPFLTYLARLKKTFFVAKKQDIIICSGKFSLWMCSLLKLVYPAKKYIAVVHGSELDLQNRLLKSFTGFSLKRFNVIVAVSDYTSSFIPLQVRQRVPVHIIPNGIGVTEFIYNNESNHVVNKDLQLITIGSVTERKGQENVIGALPALLKLYPRLKYHIVGKPVIKDKLLQVISSLNINEHVIFHGAVSRPELLMLLEQSDIKMMLSNHTGTGDFEGFGIAILEANALGKPAIGSNTGGITDAIQNGKTGILADAKNPTQIVNAVQEIMNNYVIYSTNAIQWAHEHDWRLLIKRYIALIN